MMSPQVDAQTVFFVRLGPDEKPLDDKLYASNFYKDGRAYLLNVPPGHYEAVASLFSQEVLASKDSRLVYMPQPLIEMSKVTAAAGEIAYAGSYVLAITMPGVCPKEADEAQLRYAEMMAPGVPKCGMVRMLLHQLGTQPLMVMNSQVYVLGESIYHHRGIARESKREAADESAFRAKAQADLADAGWVTGPR